MLSRNAIRAVLLVFIVLNTGIGQIPKPSQSPTQPPAPPTQTQPLGDQDDVVKITTNLVQVDAVVTKDGKLVKDLKADDFEIYEDGRKQEISSFAYISNIPATTLSAAPRNKSADVNTPPVSAQPLRINEPRRVIALVVDDLGLSAESMGSVRKQLRKFIDQQLAPNDLVAIIRTGGAMGALQQFTNDRRLIDRALSQVRWNLCSRVGIDVLPKIVVRETGEPRQITGPCGLTSSWSIVQTMRALRFIVESMGELPGRKSLVIFSDSLPREEQDFTQGLGIVQEQVGVPSTISPDNRSFLSLLQRIAERAIRSSVVIYAVDAGGLPFTGLTAADNLSNVSSPVFNNRVNNVLSSRSQMIQQRREGAELIAKETGGFLVRNSNDFELDRILEDQSGYYLIGYRPTDETFNRKFHHIKARVKKSGLTLRTRYGFFGISEDEVANAKRTPTDKMTVALLSPFGAQEIPIEMSAFFTNDKTGSFVRALTFIDAKDLQFTETPDGWHDAALQVREMVFGNNGIIVDQQTFDRKVSLRGETFEKALREGLMLQFDMPIKRPGDYQIRVAARDVTTSKVGAVGEFVQIPDLTNHQLALSGIVLSAVANPESTTSDTKMNPATRRFPSGINVRFACAIYNALSDPTNHSANVSVQMQLYRDGKQVLSSTPMQLDTKNQADLVRLVVTGVFRLNPELEPGHYFLQLIATDSLAKEKQEHAKQWIDFEIVK